MPKDLSGNLIVQLGVVAEPLNRHSFTSTWGSEFSRWRHDLCMILREIFTKCRDGRSKSWPKVVVP